MVGKTVWIHRIVGHPEYDGAIGVVTKVSHIGDYIVFFGTWGGDPIYFGRDRYQTIRKGDENDY